MALAGELATACVRQHIIRIPTLKDLIKMAELENEMRRSDEYIEKCSAVAHIPNGWLEVTAKMQEAIVIVSGFTNEMEKEIAVNHLRRAATIYPDEPTFQDLVHVRNNLANVGKYKNNDIVPNLIIHELNGKQTRLYDTFANGTNLLIASSHT